MKTSRRAETLMETLISLSILMFVIAPAAAVYANSIRNTALNRTDLTASNLADDGMEMLRNMRDTNFLKFSAKAQECWNAKPEHADINTCSQSSNKIGNEALNNPIYFRLALDADTLKWILQDAPGQAPLSADLSAETTDSFYLLKLDETPEECPLGTQPAPHICGSHRHFIDDTHLYNHQYGKDSIFYQEITIKYLELVPALQGPDAMEIVSRVLYRAGSGVRTVKRAAILTRQS